MDELEARIRALEAERLRPVPPRPRRTPPPPPAFQPAPAAAIAELVNAIAPLEQAAPRAAKPAPTPRPRQRKTAPKPTTAPPEEPQMANLPRAHNPGARYTLDHPGRHCAGMDPNLFVAPDGEMAGQAQTRQLQALAICMGCPIELECREYAIETYQIGVWGRTTDTDRARIRAERRREAS